MDELYKSDYLATNQNTDMEMSSLRVLALFAPILMPLSGADGCALPHFNQLPTHQAGGLSHPSNLISFLWLFKP